MIAICMENNAKIVVGNMGSRFAFHLPLSKTVHWNNLYDPNSRDRRGRGRRRREAGLQRGKKREGRKGEGWSR